MAVVARTYRGSLPDLAHHGRIVVADTEGRILFWYGDPLAVTFARSGAKPIQAVALCESGALEACGITDRELAVVCASHNGQPEHVEIVKGILEKGGLSAGQLLCGRAYPVFEPEKLAMLLQGLPPDELHCDCSGKHAGILLTAKHYGEDLACYADLDSPAQRRINQILCDICACSPKMLSVAVDGCGLPVHAAPMVKFAQGYARMTRPELFGMRRAAAVQRIVSAMTAHPFEVAGTGRLCTGLMEHFGDRLFCKSGAASFYAIGLLGRGIGIAVKLEDGCSEFMPGVVLHLLVQLGVISSQEKLQMREYWDQDIRNHHGQVVGRKEIDFTLKTGNTQREAYWDEFG